ncbi:hypothetical protein V2G26_016891 [Clonostachys chloroleuca]|uniref:Uncharacterized protein n=1 Tax=Clonostachys chloroleuca TaxID=1926264 RepID=A0AA35Q725_9HYPO|nr:unnamed protein product [Clonostachys chloroleuca]
MAASLLITPRYSAEDFETRSIVSAAPSYRSDAPSYHSADLHPDVLPAYTPPANRNEANNSARRRRTAEHPPASQQQTIGLPPIPPLPRAGAPNIHSFRIPTWSTQNAPAARQLHSVVERRLNAALAERSNRSTPRYHTLLADAPSSSQSRPLEDPYLVGEQAAAQARRDRMNRETGDDILIKEDQHWDCFLAQMREWDAREKNWAKFRRDVDTGRRRRILRRIGG